MQKLRFILATVLVNFCLLCTGIEATSQMLDDDYNNHPTFPSINPVNPDLVSYEKGGRIIITDAQRPGSIVASIFCIKSDIEIIPEFRDAPEEFYRDSDYGQCKYFSWRPVKDSFGNYWFAFVSDDERKIFTGFISSRKICTDSYSCNWFAIEYEAKSAVNALTGLQWSPDGSMLLFVEGDEIRLLYDLYSLIYKHSGPEFELLEESLGNGHFPAWSPDGKYIAYEPVDAESGDIRILNYLKFAQGNKVEHDFRTIERNAESITNRTKPSWSPDAKYLSYLTSLETSNEKVGGQRSWGVRVVGLNYDLAGNMHAVPAHSVFLLEENISRTYEYRSGLPLVNLVSRQNNTFLLSIENDAQNNLPIQIRDIRRGHTTVTLDLDLPRNINNQYLQAVGFDNKIRLAYTSQTGSTTRLNIDDVELPGGFRTPSFKAYKPVDLNRNSALWRSALFPGWGQLYKGEKEKALIYGGVGAIIALYALNNAWNNKGQVRRLKFNSGLVTSMVLFSGLYAYSIYDVLQGFPIITNYNPAFGNMNINISAIRNPRSNQIFPGVTLHIWD